MKRFCLLSFFFLVAASVFAQSIVHVTPSGAGNGSGASWADALPGIKLAGQVASATSGTQFWLAAGTYRPTTTTDRTASFSLSSGVSVYGGFAGTETTLDERQPNQAKTILTGNIGAPDSLDNSYHVLVLENVSADTRLDNLVITEGNSTDARFVQSDGDYEEKGAVINMNSSALFNNCTFARNVTKSPLGRGGGMYNKQSSPTLLNCTFTENFSYLGSGLYNADQSNPTLINCLFTKNIAIQGAMGSAIYNHTGSQPTLINCTITQNRDDYSGPISGDSNPATLLINCIVWGNTGSPLLGSYIPNCSYCIGDNVNADATNLNADPMFADPASGNFQLTSDSPAINAGNPDTTPLPAVDLADAPRVQGGRVDIGAYEFTSDCPNVSCLPFTVQRQR